MKYQDVITLRRFIDNPDSLLKLDQRTVLFGLIPLSGINWNAHKVAEALASKDMIQVDRDASGRVWRFWANKELTQRDVEIACLGFAKIEQLEKVANQNKKQAI